MDLEENQKIIGFLNETNDPNVYLEIPYPEDPDEEDVFALIEEKKKQSFRGVEAPHDRYKIKTNYFASDGESMIPVFNPHYAVIHEKGKPSPVHWKKKDAE
jgi:hypothetical protein